MDLSNIIKKSFEDYKKSFKLIFQSYFWLNILPYLLLAVVGLILILNIFPMTILNDFIKMSELSKYSDQNLLQPYFENISNNGIILLSMFVFVSFIVLSFFSIWLYSTLYHISLQKKKKLSFKQISKKSLGDFWKYLWLFVLIAVIGLLLIMPSIILTMITIVSWVSLSAGMKLVLILLTILMVLSSLIFLIYLMVSWIFSFFVIADEKKGVFEAIKKSRQIIKGNWWKVFGYALLGSIIVYCFMIAASALFGIINFAFKSLIENLWTTGNISIIYFVYFVSLLISYTFDVFIAVVSMPYLILFFKNMYLNLKK